MTIITNAERALWGAAALNAFRQHQGQPRQAEAAVAAYCTAKEGRATPYDVIEDVITDLLTDVLHAIAEQEREKSDKVLKIIRRKNLPLTLYTPLRDSLLTLITIPNFNTARLDLRAFSHYDEEIND